MQAGAGGIADRLKRVAALDGEELRAELAIPFDGTAGADLTPFDLTAGELARAGEALKAARPCWLLDVVPRLALAAGQARARRFWSAVLLDGADSVAAALEALSARLGTPAGRDEQLRLTAALEAMATHKDRLTAMPEGALADAFRKLWSRLEPARSPARIAEKILPFLALAEALPGRGSLLAENAGPLSALRALVEPPLARLLDERSWAGLSPVIDALLSETLLQRMVARTAPTPAGNAEDGLYVLDRAAARAFQAEIAARAYFEGETSDHARVLAALEGHDPALARRCRSATARQRVLMQAVRNLAAIRGYEALGRSGEIVAFDAAQHTLSEDGGGLPVRVRLLDPPISREHRPGRRELLQKGEAEPADDSE